MYNNSYRKINWDNPTTINERLQCFKIGEYYNNLLISKCIDKVQVKEYVKENWMQMC